MCMFGGAKAKDPVMPPEYAAQKAPDQTQADAAGQRERRIASSRTKTLLTGAGGTGATDMSGKKVLLGQ